MLKQSVFIVTLSLYSVVSACTLTGADNRFTISSNGAEVLDRKTGFTWSRCPFYSNWDGASCKPNYQVSPQYVYRFGRQPDPLNTWNQNNIKFYHHQNAFLRTKDIEGWRIPNIKELHSLISENICKETIGSSGTSLPAIYFIDPNVFPFVRTLAQTNLLQHVTVISSTPDIGSPAFYYAMTVFSTSGQKQIPVITKNGRSSPDFIVLLIKDY